MIDQTIKDVITLVLVIVVLRLLVPPPNDGLFLFLCFMTGLGTGIYRIARKQK